MRGCALSAVAHSDAGEKEPVSSHPSAPLQLCWSLLLPLTQLECERGLEKTKGHAGGFSGCFLGQARYRQRSLQKETCLERDV